MEKAVNCFLPMHLTTPKKVTISPRQGTWLQVQGPKLANRIQMSALPLTVWSRASYLSLPVPLIPHPQDGGNNYTCLVQLWWRLRAVKIIIRCSVFSNEFDAIIWYRHLQNLSFSSGIIFWSSSLNYNELGWIFSSIEHLHSHNNIILCSHSM